MATTLSDRPVGVDESIDEVCAFVAARSAEIERARRLPTEVVETLRDAGWFDLLLPPDVGGGGTALPVAAERLARLARADASTGWTVMIGAGIWCDLVGLDRPTFDDVFGREERRDPRRRLQPDRSGRGGRRRLPRGRSLGVRLGLPARHLALRQLHRGGRRRQPAADGRLRARPDPDRGHLGRPGPAGDGQPPLPGRCRRGAERADLRHVRGGALRRCADRPHPGADAARDADRLDRGGHRRGCGRRPAGPVGDQGAAARRRHHRRRPDVPAPAGHGDRRPRRRPRGPRRRHHVGVAARRRRAADRPRPARSAAHGGLLGHGPIRRRGGHGLPGRRRAPSSTRSTCCPGASATSTP